MAKTDKSSPLVADAAGGKIMLSGDSASSAELGFLLDGTFGVEELAVHDPLVTANAERLAVEGRVTILGVDDVQLTLAIEYDGPTLQLSLNRRDASEIVPELVLRLTDLSFFKEKGGPWGSSGVIEIDLFDTAMTLIAAYQEEGETNRFRFRQQIDSESVGVSLAGIGGIALSAVEMRRVQAVDVVRWQFVSDGALSFDAIPSLNAALYGTATFPPDGAEAGIAFVATSDDARNRITQTFPVPGLERQPHIVFAPRSALVARQGEDLTVHAVAGTEFFDFPPFMTAPVPGTQGTISLLPAEAREWSLTVTQDTLILGVDRLWNAGGIRAALPDLERSGQAPLPLGTLWMDAVDWSIVLGDAPSLAVTIEMAATAELNRIFGVRDDGLTPILDFFKTYPSGQDQPDAEQTTGIGLSISSKGVTAELLSSPIKQVSFEAPWWHVTLGNEAEGENYGKLRFQSPTFSYKGRSFSASGAYEVVEPLRLPMAPIKLALEGAGLKPAADALPDALPVMDVDLVDDQDRLNAGGLMALLDRTGLPEAVRTALAEAVAAADTFLERTPGAFNDFLAFQPPERLDWDMEIAPGGVRLDVSTGPDDDRNRRPIRVLMPAMDPVFGPELMGIELKGVSFGAVLGGSLGVLRLDARLERFDLATLLLCQISAGKTLDGQSVQEVHRRYIFDDILALMPTAAPAPIPIFFDALGISYRGWDGLSFETRWRFPEPEVGFLQVIDLIKATYQFVAKKDFLFDPASPAPGGLDLPFAIGPNYIRLPAYLGGALLGAEQATEGAIWPSIANVLDGLKTGQPSYFLKAIPVQARTAAADTRLGPFGFNAGLALTTPAEFAGPEGAELRAVLSQSIDNNPDSRLVEVLKSAGSGDSGAVLLAFGGFDIAGVVRFDGGFALATAAGSTGDVSGIATVVRLGGGIGALGFLIEGAMGVGTDGIWIDLRGSPLVLNGEALIAARGRMEIGSEGFRVLVTLSLTDRFALEGEWFIGKTGMEIGGALAWRYAGGKSLKAQTKAIFSSAGVEIRFGGTLFDSDVEIAARVTSSGSIGADVDIVLDARFQDAFKQELLQAADGAESTVDSAFNDLETKIEDLEFEISLRGIRDGLPGLCDQTIREIDSGIRNAINRNWPRKYGITAPGKSTAIKTALNIAKPYKARLEKLRDEVRKSDDARLHAVLKAALQEMIDNNRITARIGYPTVKVSWSWGVPRVSFPKKKKTIYSRDIMTPAQLAQLRAGIQAMDSIPAKEGIKIQAQSVYEQAVDKEALMDEIRAGIEGGLEANIPVIEAISFSTSLGLIGASATVSARVRYGDEVKTPSVEIDLTNPLAAVPAIAGAFGKRL